MLERSYGKNGIRKTGKVGYNSKITEFPPTRKTTEKVTRVLDIVVTRNVVTK
jgi:hypothetical protein